MKRFLLYANKMIDAVVLLGITVAFLYAGYCLWDNERVYASAESVYAEMNQIWNHDDLSEADNEDIAARFKELQRINPDVTAWVQVMNTGIDYPIVQGKNNLSYINTDVYGQFALAGSVFLDTRNHRDYSDVYNLLYGHNMSKHRMLSDVNLFKEEDFFADNQIGLLFLPEEAYIMQTISFFVTTSDDSMMLNPDNWTDLTAEQIMTTVQKDAMYVSEKGLRLLQEKLDTGEQPRILALGTCSPESDEARTILLMLIDP